MHALLPNYWNSPKCCSAARFMGFNPVLVIGLSSAAGIAAPRFLLRFAQTRYQRRFLDVFPDAIDLIVRAVKAGLPALDAIDLAAREVAAPVGTEFQKVLDDTRIGVAMADALNHAAGTQTLLLMVVPSIDGRWLFG